MIKLQIKSCDTGLVFQEEMPLETQITFDLLVDTIDLRDPQIQRKQLSIMQEQEDGCLMFVTEGAKLSPAPSITIFYRCYFSRQSEELEIIVKEMQDQLKAIEALRSELSYKYEKNPLEINLFWSNPVYSNDHEKRKFDKNMPNHQNLLRHSVKYAEYIDAIVDSLKKSNKKVSVKINPFNSQAFKTKNIFKVVYLIAHLEVTKNKPVINQQEKGCMSPPFDSEPLFSRFSNTSQQTDNSPHWPKKSKSSEGDHTKTKAYFLGESPDGLIEKIYPETMNRILENKIEVLVLHTSYPYYHLPYLKDHANNIILINSNPLYVELSTLYFLQQLFLLLLKTGNVEEAYNRALSATISTFQSKESIMNTFSSYPSFQRLKHYSVDIRACCCYHPHEENCLSNQNLFPSKFNQFHARYHFGHCECERKYFLEHTCKNMLDIARKEMRMIGQVYEKSEVYTCCCQGYNIGVYNKVKRNSTYHPENRNVELDPHEPRHKYAFYYRNPVPSEKDTLKTVDGQLQGDANDQFLNSFKNHLGRGLIGNKALIHQLLKEFMEDHSNKVKICNLVGEQSSGRKTVAKQLGNILLHKKKFNKLIIRTFTKPEDLFGIREETNSFYILIYVCKFSSVYFSRTNALQLVESHLFAPFATIIISQLPIKVSGLAIKKYSMNSFDEQNCKQYIKSKKNVRKGADKLKLDLLFRRTFSPNYPIYPVDLNEFQIYNILKHSDYDGSKDFIKELRRIPRRLVFSYVFLISIVAQTSSNEAQREAHLKQISIALYDIKAKGGLFYSNLPELKEKPEKNKKSSANKTTPIVTDTIQRTDQIISLIQIKRYFNLVSQVLTEDIAQQVLEIMELYVAFSVPESRSPFSNTHREYFIEVNQIYEATTNIKTSFLSDCFVEERMHVEKLRKNCNSEIRAFLQFHAGLYFTQRQMKKSFHKFQGEKSDYIAHPKAVLAAGLQFLRTVLCSHIIYNRLLPEVKLSLIKYGILLVNNAIILMKNPQFFSFTGLDLDIYESMSQSCSLKNIDEVKAQSLTKSLTLMQPEKNLMDGCNYEPQQSQDSFKKQMNFHAPAVELLNKQLETLTTYKGLLFLLAELSRRVQELNKIQHFHEHDASFFNCRTTAELLSIQIGIQQLYLNENHVPPFDRKILRSKQENHIYSAMYDRNRSINELNQFFDGQDFFLKTDNHEKVMNLKVDLTIALIINLSKCGRIRINNAIFQQIERFMTYWDNLIPLPLTRKLSVTKNNSAVQNSEEYNRMRELIGQFCEHEHLVDKLLDAMPASRQLIQKNINNDLYVRLLREYHSLKRFSDFDKVARFDAIYAVRASFRDLQNSVQYHCSSTCIRNLLTSLQICLRNEFDNLKKNLIVIITAEDKRAFVKISLQEKVVQTIQNHNELFALSMDLNLLSLDKLECYKGSRYVCITTLTHPNNSKNLLIGQSNAHPEQLLKENVVKKLSVLQGETIFCCLPKKTQLACDFIKTENLKMNLIYFNFCDNQKDDFILFEEIEKINLLQVQKMIMIETVRLIIEKVVFDSKKKSLAIEGFIRAYLYVKNHFSFVLRDAMEKDILILKNQTFRKILLLHLINSKSEEVQFIQKQQKIVFLSSNDMVSNSQYEKMQKIADEISPSKTYSTNIEEFKNPEHFFTAFKFFLRKLYGFDEFFTFQSCDFHAIITQKSTSIDVEWKKQFLKQFAGKNILEALYSQQNVGIFMDFTVEMSSNKCLSWADEELSLFNLNLLDSSIDGKERHFKIVRKAQLAHGKSKKKSIIVYLYSVVDQSQAGFH